MVGNGTGLLPATTVYSSLEEERSLVGLWETAEGERSGVLDETCQTDRFEMAVWHAVPSS
jgi:hypothetical protein